MEKEITIPETTPEIILQNPVELKAKKEKRKIKIEIYRKDGDTYLQFEFDLKLENFFAKKKHEIRESTNWPELKFYFIPDILENKNYQQLLSAYNLFDDYGSALTRNSTFNIAFLRTVGGKGKILINHDMPFATCSEGIRNIVRFVKQ